MPLAHLISRHLIVFCSFLFLPVILAANVFAGCPGSEVTVNLTSPSGPGTYASPARFTATGATSQGSTITGYVVYADGGTGNFTNVYENDNSATLDAWAVLPLASDGSAQTQSVFVRAWDDVGNCGDSSALSITASGTQIPFPLANSASFDDIDDIQSGWDPCGTKACAGGSNDSTVTLTPFVSPPSEDGGSLEMDVNGPADSNGLFLYNAGQHNEMTNFLWEFDFQLSDNTLSQAGSIEFDFWQVISLQRYMFGTQCNYSRGTWQAWNEVAQQWVDAIPNTATDDPNASGTPISCAQFSPGTWHHAIFFVQRTFDGRLLYGNVTIDGATTQWNITAPSAQSTGPWADSIGVQHQLDINEQVAPGDTTTLQEWTDKNNITAWPQN
jgi:hypothetical protein